VVGLQLSQQLKIALPAIASVEMVNCQTGMWLAVEDALCCFRRAAGLRPAKGWFCMSDHALRLYRHPLSGHCHRVELLLSFLSIPCELVDVDLSAGEHKLTAFLAKNVFGQVPVLETSRFVLADSNAILCYLALEYDRDRRWLPSGAADAARVQRWLSVAAGELATGPAALRRARIFGENIDERRARATSASLFGVLDQELTKAPFLAGEIPSIADVAMYAYSAHAPEGGVSLGPYTHLVDWLRRIEALPRFVGMRKSAIHV
jgi:glutathione S-transferase